MLEPGTLPAFVLVAKVAFAGQLLLLMMMMAAVTRRGRPRVGASCAAAGQPQLVRVIALQTHHVAKDGCTIRIPHAGSTDTILTMKFGYHTHECSLHSDTFNRS